MSKYFQLEEFLKSDTALNNGIANLPSWEVVNNLRVMADVLDGIREAYGHPIIISSGFRGKDLNEAVGGALNSAHQYGFCSDLQIKGDLKKFAAFVKEYLDSNYIKYDELIFERSGKKEWLHFALFGKDGKQRMKNFEIIS